LIGREFTVIEVVTCRDEVKDDAEAVRVDNAVAPDASFVVVKTVVRSVVVLDWTDEMWKSLERE